jgi:hypothetical protein
MSAPDDPRRAASPTPADAPVEHVRARCPTLIATLVAMARASKDRQDVDDARRQELLGNPPPNRRRRARPTGGPADVSP